MNSHQVLQGGFFNETLRTWQSRTSVINPDCLIYPLFISSDQDAMEEIHSLPGQYRIGLNKLFDHLCPMIKDGLKTVLLFAAVGDNASVKTEKGNHSGFTSANPVITAVAKLKKDFPSLTIACDVCLCAFTTHGHCGAKVDGVLDNKESLSQIGCTSCAFVLAGCDILAPSDMNDGRVNEINKGLQNMGSRHKVNIMSYSAKFASSLYGPFREAAGSAPKEGDRKCYQLPPGSTGLALRAIERDIKEGADIVMVKPAMLYMDVIKEAKTKFPYIPVAAYQVSGEYAMLYHASTAGAVDLKTAVLESLMSLHRAGADIIISYYTPLVLKWLKE